MTNSEPRPKAYSYLRFSTPEQMKGDSRRRQTDLATLYAAKHGLDLDVSSFQDLGVSAYSGDNAHTGSLFKFLQFVHEGVIPRGSLLLVESLDRLTRSDIVTAQGLLMGIIGAGIVVVTLQPGAERTYSRESLAQNPTELIIAIVEMMRAHSESSVKASRLKEAWKAKRAALGTRNLTKIGPAWLQALPRGQLGFEVREGRGEVIRSIFEQYLTGVGMESIAASLNTAGVQPFRSGVHWHRSYIAKILSNPAVIGTFTPHTQERRHGKTIRTPGEPVLNYYPAVIDEDTFKAAQAMRTGSRQGATKPRREGVRHLLAGLAKCPDCGGSMTRVMKGTGKKAGPPYLVCARAKSGAGCTYRGVRINTVEEALRSNAEFIVGTAPSGLTGLDGELEQAMEQREAIDYAQSNLIDALMEGGESRAIRERVDILQRERDEVDRRVNALASEIATKGSAFVKKAVDDLAIVLQGVEGIVVDIPKANAALRRVLDAVTVDYRAGSLVLRWKQGGETFVTFAWPTEGGRHSLS